MKFLILIDSYDDRVTQIVDEEYLDSPEFEACGGKVLEELEEVEPEVKSFSWKDGWMKRP
jgi:hypothetical protein